MYSYIDGNTLEEVNKVSYSDEKVEKIFDLLSVVGRLDSNVLK